MGTPAPPTGGFNEPETTVTGCPEFVEGGLDSVTYREPSGALRGTNVPGETVTYHAPQG